MTSTDPGLHQYVINKIEDLKTKKQQAPPAPVERLNFRASQLPPSGPAGHLVTERIVKSDSNQLLGQALRDQDKRIQKERFEMEIAVKRQIEEEHRQMNRARSKQPPENRGKFYQNTLQRLETRRIERHLTL